MNRLVLPYGWSTRAILLDKLEATRLLTWSCRKPALKRRYGQRHGLGDRSAHRRREAVMGQKRIIPGRDFNTMTGAVNAVDAWREILPGHAYANVRQPPISTLKFA